MRVHPWAAKAGLPGTTSGEASSSAAAASFSYTLTSAATALAWVDGGDGSPEGCGSGGLLAAALLAGGIQLLSVDAAGSSSGGSGVAGRLVPTALLRGHGGIIRSLQWLPPQLEASQPAAEAPAAKAPIAGRDAPTAGAAGAAPGQQDLALAAEGSLQGGPERAALGEGAQAAALPSQADGQALQPGPRRRQLLLLSGGEDGSVRLWDVNRQLAAWRQRQEAAAAEAEAAAATEAAAAQVAAAAAAAVAAVQVTAAEPEEAARAPAAAAAGRADVGSAATVAIAGGAEAPAGITPRTPAAAPVLQHGKAAGEAGKEPPPPPPAQRSALAEPSTSQSAGAAATSAAAQQAVALTVPGTAASSGGAVAAAAAAQQAAPGPAGGSKKKAAASLLGDRGVLQATRIAEDDRRQQQAAQQACLHLAQHLLAEAARQAAADVASAGARAPPPPPPPAQPLHMPAGPLLLDCAADPLSASLALAQHCEGLAAGAAAAPSSSSRAALAQRAAAAALLRGDVGAAVQVLLDHDALTADFVSMSAAAGGPAWLPGCLAPCSARRQRAQHACRRSCRPRRCPRRRAGKACGVPAVHSRSAALGASVPSPLLPTLGAQAPPPGVRSPVFTLPSWSSRASPTWPPCTCWRQGRRRQPCRQGAGELQAAAAAAGAAGSAAGLPAGLPATGHHPPHTPSYRVSPAYGSAVCHAPAWPSEALQLSGPPIPLSRCPAVPRLQVYRRAGLLREAVALATARLLPGHPLLPVRTGLRRVLAACCPLLGMAPWCTAGALAYEAAHEPHELTRLLTGADPVGHGCSFCNPRSVCHPLGAACRSCTLRTLSSWAAGRSTRRRPPTFWPPGGGQTRQLRCAAAARHWRRPRRCSCADRRWQGGPAPSCRQPTRAGCSGSLVRRRSSCWLWRLRKGLTLGRHWRRRHCRPRCRHCRTSRRGKQMQRGSMAAPVRSSASATRRACCWRWAARCLPCSWPACPRTWPLVLQMSATPAAATGQRARLLCPLAPGPAAEALVGGTRGSRCCSCLPAFPASMSNCCRPSRLSCSLMAAESAALWVVAFVRWMRVLMQRCAALRCAV